MTRRSRVADEGGIAEIDVGVLAHHPDPYPLYRLMREREPIKYSPDSNSWRLTRHADITAVLRDARFGFPAIVEKFPSWHALISELAQTNSRTDNPSLPLPLQWLRLQKKVFEMRQLWILVQNPPAHTRLRALVQSHYTLTAARTWEPFIQTTADALIDAVEARGEMDVIRDFANPLVLALTLQIMGMPFADRPKFDRWSHELGHLLEAETTVLDHRRIGVAGINLIEYFHTRLEARQAPYGNDVTGSLLRDFKSDKLSEDELLAMCTLLALGGHSTTRSMLGNGMLALLRHPDQWRMLSSQPGLVSSATEECLRYDTPGQTAGRVAFTDVSLDGVTIEKGQWVNLLLGAGNWDPDVFPEPERFDITRRPSPHLGFGHGIHYCLGAHLARAVMRISLKTLSRRLPGLALRDDAVEWAQDQHQRGPKTLPVVFPLG